MVRGPAMAPAAGPGALARSGSGAAAAAAAAAAAEEMRWRQFDSGVSAVSFGFVATAILVSMFLAMAILEHFLRPPAARASAPTAGVLRRLRFLVGRAAEGEPSAAPGADLEAARKLDGRAPLELSVLAWLRFWQLCSCASEMDLIANLVAPRSSLPSLLLYSTMMQRWLGGI